MNDIKFYEYKIESDILCLGERMKKGTYRPCVKTIPSTQVIGAIKARFGIEVIAAGYFTSELNCKLYDFAPAERFFNTARLPLTIEYLNNPKGKIFILSDHESKNLPKQFDLRMGALKSKGFGFCSLEYQNQINNPTTQYGKLITRLREDELSFFGVNVYKPIYGYLFKPTDEITGVYQRSLFEGSLIQGYYFLVGQVEYK